MPMICELRGVREHCEGDPVELWRDNDTGRLVIRAQNECGNNSTHVDLFDLLDWMSAGPHQWVLEDTCGIAGSPNRSSAPRD